MASDEKAWLELLQRIEKRLEAIEKTVEKTQSHVHQTFHIEHIETMNIQELTYHLENVDVKQLSGTMNIGNTFPYSANTARHVKPENQSKEEIYIRINGKNIPYQIGKPQKELQEDDRKPLSANFTIGDIHIGAVEDASAVSFGNNFPTDFKSSKKHNQGFGNILGNGNDIHDILSHQEERDVTEVFSDSPDQPQPEWLKWLKEQKNDGEEEGEPE
ncbi:hypothetical protein [Bacillus sp. SJS]|uniref:hypothetical protein n=1 Tax=Bacillus sp. SJS TaxID=1423321 RepID=UPI0004DD1776|nr:hypothetical protein [Bacillus sp. SJS]KZZ84795.1 hypothetical protein AS29_009715 [Bacillus sp. SJS]